MKTIITLLLTITAWYGTSAQYIGTSIQKFGVLPTNNPQTDRENLQKAIDQAAKSGAALFVEPVENPFTNTNNKAIIQAVACLDKNEDIFNVTIGK